MVTRSPARLSLFGLFGISTLFLALLTTADPARATGEHIQEIRFFSRSGMDPEAMYATSAAASASCVRPLTTSGSMPPIAG